MALSNFWSSKSQPVIDSVPGLLTFSVFYRNLLENLAMPAPDGLHNKEFKDLTMFLIKTRRISPLILLA